MSESSSDSDPLKQFPPITPDGFAVAAEFSDSATKAIEKQTGVSMDPATKASILEMLAPGASYFHELTSHAGELAGSGDPLGALALLGGEENARDLIGDEETDGLIAEAVQQMSQSEPTRPEDV